MSHVDCLNSPPVSTLTRLLTVDLRMTASVFVFCICLCLLHFCICLCLCPVPFLTSSCFMSIFILSFVTAMYLLFCQLPTLGSLLLQKFKLSAILNDILILPSYWLVLPVIRSTSSNFSLFYLFSYLVSKTMLLSQGFPRLVPRESNTGYMHSPFQFFYIIVPNMKQEKWINMWTFLICWIWYLWGWK